MTFQLMEPELEELLQTIAADPRSSLLRVDRPTILRGLFDRDPMVRESCTQLTSAERQLLRVHRHELGRLLRAACFDLLLGHNLEVFHFCLDHGGGSFPTQIELDEAREGAISVVRTCPRSQVRAAVVQAIASSDPMIYAMLACRVDASCASYLSANDCFELQVDARRARIALSRARLLVTSENDLAHVLSYEAHSSLSEGDLTMALRTYRLASHASGHWPNEVLSWLALSVQCANERSFSEALEVLEAHEVVPTTLRAWTSAMTSMRTAGLWTPTRDSISFLNAHDEVSSEQANDVVQRLFRPKV